MDGPYPPPTGPTPPLLVVGPLKKKTFFAASLRGSAMEEVPLIIGFGYLKGTVEKEVDPE